MCELIVPDHLFTVQIDSKNVDFGKNAAKIRKKECAIMVGWAKGSHWLCAIQKRNKTRRKNMDLQLQASAQDLPRGETMIREMSLSLAGYDICYRLFERGSHFVIEVSLGADRTRSDVGNSFSRAAYLYELLVQGEVTPCTVQDVLEDFALT